MGGSLVSLLDRIYRINWIFLLYLQFPPARNASQPARQCQAMAGGREAGGEEIPNEQSATPRRKVVR